MIYHGTQGDTEKGEKSNGQGGMLGGGGDLVKKKESWMKVIRNGMKKRHRMRRTNEVWMKRYKNSKPVAHNILLLMQTHKSQSIHCFGGGVGEFKWS